MPKDQRLNKTAYAGKKGYVQTFKSVCGHTMQMDCTPGKERMMMKHGSGTEFQIDFEGGMDSLIEGDNKHYVKGGSTSTSDENRDNKDCGHGRCTEGGAINFEVSGDMQLSLGGDGAVLSIGALNISAKSVLITSSGDLNMRGQKVCSKCGTEEGGGTCFVDAGKDITLIADSGGGPIDFKPSKAP